jgi:hypothetical protein
VDPTQDPGGTTFQELELNGEIAQDCLVDGWLAPAADLRSHLRTFLRTDLRTQRVVDGLQLVGHEGLQITQLIRLPERCVVALLARADHLLDRQPGEQRIPAAEDLGLPEATDAAVAIGKGMVELQLVVRHAAHEQGMPVA